MNIFGFENYIVKGVEGLNPKLKWTWRPANWHLISNTKSLLNYNSKVEVFDNKSLKKGYTLILSRKTPIVGHIMKLLKKQKKPFVFINWDEFVEEGIIYYDESENAYQLRYKKEVFDLKKVKSIFIDYFEILEVFYFRRDRFTNKEKLFLARWIEALKTLEAVCEKATWYPSTPQGMSFEGQNKYLELMKAKKMGLNIPRMIYSNDPREVQKFLLKRKSILKESGLRFFYDNKSNMKLFDARVVDPKNKKLHHIQTAPCMFQEFIEKQYDIRAVVVENKVLAAKIESAKDKNAIKDWRGKEHLVPFKPYKLPASLEKKLVRFMKDMGFRIANFDLVRGVDGKYYFLEMNRPGQWFFIEVLSGIPVTKTLTKNF